MSKKSKKQIRVLSIDDGGVRGIIPARILQEIETRTGKRIHELFDLIVGNSTGGILALGLVTPDEKGQAKLTAQDLVSFYQQNSPKIFSTSFWRKLRTGWGLWNPKYSRDNLDNILKEILGEMKMSQTLTPAMAISYSLDRSMPHLLTTRAARGKILPKTITSET
ncbi:MAG: patatin-like phospholipase family protein [Bacteroidota bacterium]